MNESEEELLRILNRLTAIENQLDKERLIAIQQLCLSAYQLATQIVKNREATANEAATPLENAVACQSDASTDDAMLQLNRFMNYEREKAVRSDLAASTSDSYVSDVELSPSTSETNVLVESVSIVENSCPEAANALETSEFTENDGPIVDNAETPEPFESKLVSDSRKRAIDATIEDIAAKRARKCDLLSGLNPQTPLFGMSAPPAAVFHNAKEEKKTIPSAIPFLFGQSAMQVDVDEFQDASLPNLFGSSIVVNQPAAPASDDFSDVFKFLFGGKMHFPTKIESTAISNEPPNLANVDEKIETIDIDQDFCKRPSNSSLESKGVTIPTDVCCDQNAATDVQDVQGAETVSALSDVPSPMSLKVKKKPSVTSSRLFGVPSMLFSLSNGFCQSLPSIPRTVNDVLSLVKVANEKHKAKALAFVVAEKDVADATTKNANSAAEDIAVGDSVDESIATPGGTIEEVTSIIQLSEKCTSEKTVLAAKSIELPIVDASEVVSQVSNVANIKSEDFNVHDDPFDKLCNELLRDADNAEHGNFVVNAEQSAVSLKVEASNLMMPNDVVEVSDNLISDIQEKSVSETNLIVEDVVSHSEENSVLENGKFVPKEPQASIKVVCSETSLAIEDVVSVSKEKEYVDSEEPQGVMDQDLSDNQVEDVTETSLIVEDVRSLSEENAVLENGNFVPEEPQTYIEVVSERSLIVEDVVPVLKEDYSVPKESHASMEVVNVSEKHGFARREDGVVPEEVVALPEDKCFAPDEPPAIVNVVSEHEECSSASEQPQSVVNEVSVTKSPDVPQKSSTTSAAPKKSPFTKSKPELCSYKPYRDESFEALLTAPPLKTSSDGNCRAPKTFRHGVVTINPNDLLITGRCDGLSGTTVPLIRKHNELNQVTLKDIVFDATETTVQQVEKKSENVPIPEIKTKNNTTPKNTLCKGAFVDSVVPQRHTFVDVYKRSIGGANDVIVIDDGGERIELRQKVTEVILDNDEDSPDPHPVLVHKALVKHLKPHQATGIKFMYNCLIGKLADVTDRSYLERRNGAILSHCMGLGKTLQAITLLHTLMTHKVLSKYYQRALVLCPASLMHNWANEFIKWLDGNGLTGIKVLDLSQDNAKDWEQKRRNLRQWQSGTAIVLLVSIELFSREKSFTELSAFLVRSKINKCAGADIVICDESHKLSSDTANRSVYIRMISALSCVGLSGTPMQNNLEEYFHLVNWVAPGMLGTMKKFKTEYIMPIQAGSTADASSYDVQRMKSKTALLNRQLDLVMDRKDYSYLAKILPPKKEYVLFLRMTQKHEDVYREWMQSSARTLKALDREHFTYRLGTLPYNVIKNAKDSESMDWANNLLSEADSDKYSDSQKINITLDLLKMFEQEGAKAIIFTQYLDPHPVLLAALKAAEGTWFKDHTVKNMNGENWSWNEFKDYYVLTGKTQMKTRAAILKAFNDPENLRGRLLIMTKTACEGLNIVAATKMIIFEAKHNPELENQALFRSYRIGQTKPFSVFRLVYQGTMEECIFKRQIIKQQTNARVLDNNGATRTVFAKDVSYSLQFNPAPPEMDYTKQEHFVLGALADPIVSDFCAAHKDILVDVRQHDALLALNESEKLPKDEVDSLWDGHVKLKHEDTNAPTQSGANVPRDRIQKRSTVASQVVAKRISLPVPSTSSQPVTTVPSVIDLTNLPDEKPRVKKPVAIGKEEPTTKYKLPPVLLQRQTLKRLKIPMVITIESSDDEAPGPSKKPRSQ